MPAYRVDRPMRTTMTYLVTANSPSEALCLVDAGGGELLSTTIHPGPWSYPRHWIVERARVQSKEER